jgi:hypothetical protein
MGVRSSHASAGSQQQAWSCLDRAFVRSHAHCGASPDAVTVDLGINGFVASQPINQSCLRHLAFQVQVEILWQITTGDTRRWSALSQRHRYRFIACGTEGSC